MKFSTGVKQFRDAFGVASRVVPSRTPKPILMNVKVIASDIGVELMATDLELGIRHPLAGVQVIEPGSGLLPKEVTDKILKSADDDVVSMEWSGGKVNVKCGKAKWSVQCDDADLFPSVPNVAGPASFTVSGADLISLVRRTSYATDPKSTRYALGGMMIEIGNERVSFVATDGRRVAVQKCLCDPGVESKGQKVIPVSAGQLLADCGKGDVTGELSFTDQAMIAKVGGTTIYSRLVDGRFPRYQDCYPDQTGVKVCDIDPELFGQALGQGSATSSDESRGVDFTFADGALVMSSQAEQGTSEAEFAIAYQGPKVEITFDPRYLIEALKAVGSQPISISLIDHKHPAVFTTEDGFSYVVMPLTRDR